MVKIHLSAEVALLQPFLPLLFEGVVLFGIVSLKRGGNKISARLGFAASGARVGDAGEGDSQRRPLLQTASPLPSDQRNDLIELRYAPWWGSSNDQRQCSNRRLSQPRGSPQSTVVKL